MTVPAPDPSLYTTGDPFQREKQALFAAAWLPFAASGQLPGPGDFIAHSFGGWSLFAIRGGDGIARAFRNVCRHQMMPVVAEGAGHCDELRCRFHGWTYAFDGSFLSAPPRWMPPDPAGQPGLEPVELSERDGVCLVRVDGEGEPPRLGFPGRPFATAIATDIDANWKAVVEALLAAGTGGYGWPAVFQSEPEAGTGVVRQIVPRSFLRTRIVDLVFCDGGVVAEPTAARLGDQAAVDKQAAEAWQAGRAAGEAVPSPEPVSDFVRRVAAACAWPAPGG